MSNASTMSYTVGNGDTLTLVAARYNTTPSELTSLNKLNSSFIYPGQQLLVPVQSDRGDGKEGDDVHVKSVPTDDKRFKAPVLQRGVVVQPNFGADPTIATCFNCRNVVTTKIIESANATCCFLFGCWSLCCPGCQDVEHRCPMCNVILGVYKPA